MHAEHACSEIVKFQSIKHVSSNTAVHTYSAYVTYLYVSHTQHSCYEINFRGAFLDCRFETLPRSQLCKQIVS